MKYANAIFSLILIAFGMFILVMLGIMFYEEAQYDYTYTLDDLKGIFMIIAMLFSMLWCGVVLLIKSIQEMTRKRDDE